MKATSPRDLLRLLNQDKDQRIRDVDYRHISGFNRKKRQTIDINNSIRTRGELNLPSILDIQKKVTNVRKV